MKIKATGECNYGEHTASHGQVQWSASAGTVVGGVGEGGGGEGHGRRGAAWLLARYRAASEGGRQARRDG